MSRYKELKPEQPKKPQSPKKPRPNDGSSNLPFNMSRRAFALGAAAVAGVTGAIGFVGSHLLGAGKKQEEDPAASPVIVNSGDATSITEAFEQVEPCRLQEAAEYDLPLGSVLFPAEGNWLPMIQPGDTTSAMCCAAAFHITDGEQVIVVPQPLNSSPNALILDVRCSDSVFAWSEVDISQRNWKLYGSTWANGALTGKATTLWESDANWDPPSFACAGNRVLWQVQPSLSGEKTNEPSSLYAWSTGSASAEKILESPGRFACEPAVGQDTITVVPRAESSGVYYSITALDKSNPKKVVDSLVMPQSVRPYKACRIGDQFAFSVEATYGTGGLLSNMGYYLGTSKSHITWLSREPAAGVWGRGGAYVFKARSSYIVYDADGKKFSVLLAANRAVDYGEYPAATADTSTFATFATVKDQATGYPSKVVVRVFDTISSEEAQAQYDAIQAQKQAEAEAAAAAAAAAEQPEE